MKKGIFKKTALSIGIVTALLSFDAQARWCGNPICPGDILTDTIQDQAREHLQSIQNIFTYEQMIPALMKQLEQQFTLFGKRAASESNFSIMNIGSQTDVTTDLFNQEVLSQLQPIEDEACQLLTWQDYASTATTKIVKDKLSEASARISGNSIRGEGMTEQEKKLSLFNRIQHNEGKTGNIGSPGDWLNKDTLDKDNTENALLAIDTLTYTEGRDGIAPKRMTNTEDNAYKLQFVDSSRKALVYNLIRQMLSDPVYERVGVSNADNSTSVDEGDRTAPTQANNTEDFIDDIINHTENSEANLDESFDNSPLGNFLSSPVRYTRISSGFNPGRIHPVLGVTRPHKGVDLAAPTGEPIYAPADGNFLKVGVDSAGLNAGFGNMIIINHSNGIQTWYGHLDGFADVRTGQDIQKGDLIGYVGNTGHSTGAHLHYEIRVDGEPVDPMGRYGISETQATGNLMRSLLGDNTFDSTEYSSMGEEMADGETTQAEFYRKMLLVRSMEFEKALKEYKEIEKLKITLAVDALNQLNK